MRVGVKVLQMVVQMVALKGVTLAASMAAMRVDYSDGTKAETKDF